MEFIYLFGTIILITIVMMLILISKQQRKLKSHTSQDPKGITAYHLEQAQEHIGHAVHKMINIPNKPESVRAHINYLTGVYDELNSIKEWYIPISMPEPNPKTRLKTYETD